MNTTEQPTFNFHSEENVVKWKKMFVAALDKKLIEVHPKLTITPDALEKIEKLLVRMLETLCTPTPFLPHHTVADVLKRVNKKFLEPIKTWALNDANAAIDKYKATKKANFMAMPVDKIHQLLVKEVFNCKIDYQVSLYISAVLDYIAGDMLKLIGNYVKNIKHSEITYPDIDVAMCADKVLMAMLFEDDDDDDEEHVMDADRSMTQASQTSQSYNDVLRDLLLEESRFLRELNMLLWVFKENINKFPELIDEKMDMVFEALNDIHELTSMLIASLEDTMEACKDCEVAAVGWCFDEFMEGLEFNVYEKYYYYIFTDNEHVRWTQQCTANKKLNEELSKPGLADCIKYVFPCLLLEPFHHFIYYCDILKILMDRSSDEEDRALLKQTCDRLTLIRNSTEMEKKLASCRHFRRKGSYHLEKLDQIQRSIDGWDGRNLNQLCNGYITEGSLQKVSGRRISDRYVFLLDGLVVLTKRIAPQARKSVSAVGSLGSYEFKLKEKFVIRKIDVVDRDDSEELKNAFEIIQHKQQSSMVLIAKSLEEKIHWLSAFFSLINRSTLERLLDSKLKEEEKKQPLQMPTPDQYRFAVEDSEDNILFEDNGYDNGNSNDIPVIKGGTILKLVERLTFHSYFDPKFIKTFLTTYRTFITPEKLLSLLIERFSIPEPRPYDVDRESLKKFRNTFIKPISFRVLNVLRLWVEHHWYDFEDNKPLQNQVKDFVDGSVRGRGKLLIKWVDTILKIMERKFSMIPNEPKQITFNTKPPIIEWHITKKPDEFDLMNLHPIEIARQVTLLEFEIFQKIKSSEMVGAVWMRKNKHLTSPNLLKMIHHTTKFTFWLEKCIIEAENFDERVAVVCRVLELLVVFQELNNFNGVIEVYSALNSASVHRLDHTFEEIENKHPKHNRAYEEAKDLNADHFKRYVEKLRSINPPCIPFLGMYLTNILKLEEGNPDYLPNRPPEFINFSKRRKVYEITSEIQQYQNQPYCLSVEPSIRAFIENLRPLADKNEKDFDDYLYERSLFIEPRHGKPAKLERKRPYSLKSPGTKPTSYSTLSAHHRLNHHHNSNLPQPLRHPATAHHRHNHSSHQHPHQNSTGMIPGQEDLLNESSSTDSDQTTPVTPRSPSSSCSPHYNSGDDGSGSVSVSGKTLVSSYGSDSGIGGGGGGGGGGGRGGGGSGLGKDFKRFNFHSQSDSDVISNPSLRSSTSTLTISSSKTITPSPQPSILNLNLDDDDTISGYSHSGSIATRKEPPPSVPPPLPPREKRSSVISTGSIYKPFDIATHRPPLTDDPLQTPPALPPREHHHREYKTPPPLPPRCPEPLSHHHHLPPPLPTTTNDDEEAATVAAAAACGWDLGGGGDCDDGGGGDDDDDAPELPPKAYQRYSSSSSSQGGLS